MFLFPDHWADAEVVLMMTLDDRRRYERERKARWRSTHPEKAEAAWRRALSVRKARPRLPLFFGTTCDICGGRAGKRALAVDHDHETGLIRGKLCFHCNVGIGHFKDNPVLLRAALVYLERPR